MASGGNITDKYTIFKIGDLVHVEWTAMLFVFCVFITVMFLMNHWLFRPILNLSKKQQGFVDDSQAEAEATEKSLKSIQEEYHAKNVRIISEIESFRDSTIGEAKDIALKAVNGAKAKSTELLHKNTDEVAALLEAQKSEAREEIQKVKKAILEAI